MAGYTRNWVIYFVGSDTEEKVESKRSRVEPGVVAHSLYVILSPGRLKQAGILEVPKLV